MIHYAPWRNLFAHCGIDLILDVGANIGQTYDSFRWAGFEGPIYSFEPNPEMFQRLQRHPGHDWKKFPYALSSQSGQAVFNIVENDNACGLQAPLTQFTVQKQINVTTFRLDELWKREGFSGKNVFLKIDAEGHDAEVIKGASGVLDHIPLIMAEVAPLSRYKGEPELPVFVDFLKDLGYCLCRSDKNSFDAATGIDTALDLVFIRRELAPKPAA